MMFTLVFALLVAQAGSSPQAPMKENRAPVPAQLAPTKLQTYPDVDETFAIAAIQGNNAEMDMAELALKRSNADEVKGYAKKMISEHEGLMDEMTPVLQRLLAGKTPERLAPADKLALLHLQSLPPSDFNQMYTMQQIGDHLASLTAFKTAADNGTDSQLKELARKWTPTIQAHLELAVDLTKHVGGSSPFASH